MKYHGNFCLEIGNTGSNLCALSTASMFCFRQFVFKVHSVALYLCSLHTATQPSHQ